MQPIQMVLIWSRHQVVVQFYAPSNALKESDRNIDYINAHGTRPLYISELNAIGSIFKIAPLISSTKSMTGHSLGAGSQAIYSILMMHNNFLLHQ